MEKNEKTTVGGYLIKRLEEIGLEHIFGVPGDYVLHIFDLLEESTLKVIGTCNELEAGYAADGYARIKGISAIVVTYAVGGLSAINAVEGANAERLPMVVISGAPKSTERRFHHLLHHTVGDMDRQRRTYQTVTETAIALLNPSNAPQQIDEALATCLRTRRPVYIEIPADVAVMPCSLPLPIEWDRVIKSDSAAVEEAVEETARILSQAKNPVIVAGIESSRFCIQKELQNLVEHTGYPFATTLLAKSVLSERHPQFIGVYAGRVGQECARKRFEEADVVLSLGALMTDVDLGHGTAHFEPARMINANSDKVRIHHHVYDQVSLKDFVEGLMKKLPKGNAEVTSAGAPAGKLPEKFAAVAEQGITLERFYKRLNHFLDENTSLVVDTGSASSFGAINLVLPDNIRYINQSFYMSIGFSVPATIGVKFAEKSRRTVTIVGDGAFQMTAQALSTMCRHRMNSVIFLMNNDGYTIERIFEDGAYNDINMWKYHMLPEVFQFGWGVEVKTEGDLEAALKRAEENPDELAFIEVRLDKMDCPSSLRGVLKL